MYFFQLIYPSLGFQQWACACVSLMCEVSPSSSALESNWLNAPWPWGFVEFGIEHNETWHCFAISPPFTSISGMKGHKDEGLLDPWKCLRPKWQDHRSVRKADEGDSRGWDMVLRLYCRIVLHSFWGSYNFGQYPNDLASPYKLGLTGGDSSYHRLGQDRDRLCTLPASVRWFLWGAGNWESRSKEHADVRCLSVTFPFLVVGQAIFGVLALHHVAARAMVHLGPQ